jgi:hypothetical protein
MTGASPRRGLGLANWLLIVLLLLLAGAGATIWSLSRYQAAARFLGVVPEPAIGRSAPTAVPLAGTPALPAPSTPLAPAGDETQHLAVLEARIARLEHDNRQVAGAAGRADALLVGFAARRAVDRGVPLGYLEPLLNDRFGATHRQAVATVITGARTPVRLDQLIEQFDTLGPALQRGPELSVWGATRRELASLVAIRRTDRPNPRPSATFERARARLQAGQVDQAMAEAMRLPGIGQAGPWVQRARSYVAVHRALDEIESAALLAR